MQTGTNDAKDSGDGDAAERLKAQLESGKQRLSSWNETAAAYIRENPGRCLLGALAVGFVIGKLARRA